MSAKVFVLGSFVVDCAYRAPRLPVLGETLLGTNFTLGPGGKGSNQAVAAARSGAAVTFLTSIGNDAFGEVGRKLWAEEGIDSSPTRIAEHPTGSAAILLNQSTGENAIIIVPGACSSLTPEDVDRAADAIRGAQVFLAQLEVPLAAVKRGLQIARDAGVTTILNPAPAPIEPLPSDLLGLIDYLIPNETEAGALSGLAVGSTEDVEAVITAFLAQGVINVVLTLAERGSALGSPKLPTSFHEAITAGPVVDTTGAGDSFCGAFAAALAEGQGPLAAARFASAAAGLSVTRHGTAKSMPYRGEIDLLLRTLSGTGSGK
jgi:ribokinase